MISNSFSKQWNQRINGFKKTKILLFQNCEWSEHSNILWTFAQELSNCSAKIQTWKCIITNWNQKYDLKKSQRFQLEIQLLYLCCHAIAICKWLMTRIHSKGVSKDYHFHIHSCESKEWKNLQSAWLFMYNLFNAFSST